MLFWIFVALLVVGITCLILNNTFDRFILFVPGAFATLIGGIATVVSVLVFCINHSVTDAYIAKNLAIYDSLIYQYENSIYENDNDLGKRDLMLDIQEWNASVAYKQTIQDNYWVGIYHPNIYDIFETIPLK